MRSDYERLLDIQEAIERVQKYAVSREALTRDELVQTWTIYYMQVIGEAARALSADFMIRHSDIPWSGIIGMRNILAHRYFGIDIDAVWSAVKDSLPDLKRKVEKILREMDTE